MKSNDERVMTIHYSGIKKEETSNPSDYLDLLGLLGDAAHVRAHIYHKKILSDCKSNIFPFHLMMNSEIVIIFITI